MWSCKIWTSEKKNTQIISHRLTLWNMFLFSESFQKHKRINDSLVVFMWLVSYCCTDKAAVLLDLASHITGGPNPQKTSSRGLRTRSFCSLRHVLHHTALPIHFFWWGSYFLSAATYLAVLNTTGYWITPAVTAFAARSSARCQS